MEDLSATNDKISRLERQNASTAWAERVKWQGDFRYRFEEIQEEGRDDRDRNRIWARGSLVARPADTAEVGLENTVLTASKFKNPFYVEQKNGLIWDRDFRPEGISATWDNETVFAVASYNFIESDSRDDDDGIWGVQVGTRLGLFDTLELTAAAKYLDIPAKGRGAVIDDDFFGNTAVDTDGDGVPDAYKFDYNFYNLSLGIGFHVFATDVVLYGDYVENDDADDLDTGYVVGVKLGRAKTAGSWQMRYQYAELEADATLGVVTDSNFMGGGTDGEGHRLSGRYMLNEAWYLGATYFDGNSGVNLGNDADYQRFVLDTGCSY